MADDRPRNTRRLAECGLVLVLLGFAAAVFADALDGTARVVALVGVGLAVGLLAFWKLPQWQAEAAYARDQTKSRFELENAARQTLAQALGGLFLVVGLAATWLQLDQSRQEQRDTAARVATEQALTRERAATEQALTREGQITDRFTAAVNQLGSEQLRVRLGGIYALERIAADSPDDVVAVLEILTAFVRERAPWSTPPGSATPIPDAGGPVRPEEDVQTVLTVLERGRWAAAGIPTPDAGATPAVGGVGLGCLDLDGADLRGVRIRGPFLIQICLESANLAGADLFEAELPGAYLLDADLSGANLLDANLTDAFLWDANLTGASLYGANLTGADLRCVGYFNEGDCTDLTGAIISEAILTGALLDGAILEDASLYGTDLSGARLSGADLQGAGMLDAVLTDADLREATLEDVALFNANLSGADLRGADLTGAFLTGADLSGADLTGADLTGADLTGADLTQAQIDSAFWETTRPPTLPPGLTASPPAAG